MTLRVRLGCPGTSSQKLTAVSFSTAPVTASCAGAAVAVGTTTDRWNNGGKVISATTITFSGLQANRQYTYSVSQGGESVSGSFRTLPDDQTTDFSFIASTCDYQLRTDFSDAYTAVRKVMGDFPEPMLCQFHIDDVAYFDTWEIVDSASGITASGRPQDTGLGRNYAAAYAAYYGLMNSEPKWQQEDRQWAYRNLPMCASGGDHAICSNHCRGEVGAVDYHSCDRSPGGLEETAKAEWDAFIGDMNPTPLRAGKWHWGVDIGSVRFALFDYSLYAEPYDPPTTTDGTGYGAEQISDIMTWMDVSSPSFKCFLHESHPYFGQGWRRWHPTEADGWKASHDAAANMNGVSGNSFSIAGDNHALYATEFDTFWCFGPGTLNSSRTVDFGMETGGGIVNLAAVWSGVSRWHKQAFATTGDRLLSGFWHFRVLASQSPQKIEARCYHAPTGTVMSGPWTLEAGATDNQWTEPVRRFA